MHLAVIGIGGLIQLDGIDLIVCLQGLGVCGLAAGANISCRPLAVLRSRGLGQGTAFFFVMMTQRRDNIPVHLICANGAEVGRIARSGAGGQYRIPRLVIMLVTADFKFRLGAIALVVNRHGIHTLGAAAGHIHNHIDALMLSTPPASL